MSTRLLERSAQLASLDDALAAVSSSRRGQLTFVAGEAGAGKTALIRQFCERHVESVQVLVGACDALFTPRPLGPLLDIANATGGELHELTGRGGHPYEVAAALMRELRARAPIVLVLEDVHWADEATFDVLRLLGRRVELVPALIVASYRDDGLERDHPLRLVLGELPSGSTVGRLKVTALSLAAVAELARPHGVDAAELYRKTAGNAFFVTEALAAGDAEIPATVRDAVLARAARLGPAARLLLEAVAVAPPQAEVGLLASVAGDVLDEVDACVSAGVLTALPGAVAFRHELARLAIEDSVTPMRRAVLHRRVLDALAVRAEAVGGVPDLERLAHHAEAASDAEAVHRYAPAAGDRAAQLGAHREAGAQYARALRFADGLAGVVRAVLLERQAAETFLCDQVDVAIRAGREAVERFREAGDPFRQADAMGNLSHYLRCTGSAIEALAIARHAVALLEQPGLPRGQALAMAYATVANVYLNAEDADCATAYGERALALARELDDADVTIRTLNTLGTVALLCGDAGGRVQLQQSLELAKAAGLQEQAGRAFINFAWIATRLRNYDDAERMLHVGIEYCDEHGLLLWRHNLVAYGARMALDLGRWSDAVERAHQVLNDTRVGNPRTPALVVLGLARARRGDPDAWLALDEARAHADASGELQFMGPVAAARAEVAWLEGRFDAVREETSAALELALARRSAWVAGELALWRWRAGVDEVVDAVADPFSLEMHGDWLRAATAWTERGCFYEAALALASGDDANMQRQALAELLRLGAHDTASAVARRLRELGARGLPRGPRALTRSNVAGLTAREQEILELLGLGLRNGEIAERLSLSAKTVDHHVSAILGKLGVRSRTEATRAAVRLGVLTD